MSESKLEAELYEAMRRYAMSERGRSFPMPVRELHPRRDGWEVRFWRKVDLVSSPAGCWEWKGYRKPTGYGRLSVDGVMTLAHRASYRLLVGAIPAGAEVMHRCDNPPCVNPEHLVAGTHAANMEDRARKGRYQGVVDWSRAHFGESSSTAKLRDDDVKGIRSSQETADELSERYGVSKSTIWRVRRRQGWAHVE